MNITLAKELNAILAVAARDVTNAIKDWKTTLIMSFAYPLLFLGLLGGSIGQSFGGGLGYNYMQFALLGMLVTTLFQFTAMGMSSLVEDRANNFTQEIFVSPISRYSIVLGKIIGTSVISLFSLVAYFIIAPIFGIPLGLSDIGHILLIAPLLCLTGGALGVLICSLFNSPKSVNIGTMVVVFPQMFLAGALIPITNSGIFAFLAHLMPMTYLVDLIRGVFYQGTPAYSQVVLFNPGLDLLVTVGFFLAFLVGGTLLFVKGERNK
jgi:ABC-2 type transport system permease protein